MNKCTAFRDDPGWPDCDHGWDLWQWKIVPGMGGWALLLAVWILWQLERLLLNNIWVQSYLRDMQYGMRLVGCE